MRWASRPIFTSDNVDQIRALTKPPLKERAEQYLLAAAARSPRLDHPLRPVTTDLVAISYSEDANDLAVLLNYLQQEGLMSVDLDTNGVRRLTPHGFIAADELRTRRAASSQAFVAMCFNEEMMEAYASGIEPGILYAGFKPMLISKKEHANKIDDEIIAEIRRSAFLVADFTEHRQNVYFETGFAIGLGLHVIWKCRKDHVKDLHFDIRQYNSIDWKDAADLKTRLKQRIEAMFGHGPIVN
jgi:nucleoside 2-deoxyribosyltransferase